MVSISVNGKLQEIDADPEMPILWVVREKLAMPGTKFGCGIAQCGACTVHLDGKPIRSCSTPISAAEGKAITTIEGLADEDGTLTNVQQAWISEQVPQCGYCQSGQIMSATALLRETPQPSDEQINAYMKGNVCRCGMYGRIRKAIKVAAGIEPATGQASDEEAAT